MNVNNLIPRFETGSLVKVLSYPERTYKISEVIIERHFSNTSFTYKVFSQEDITLYKVMPQHMIRPAEFYLPKLGELGEFVISLLQDYSVLPLFDNSHSFSIDDQDFAVFYKISNAYRINLNYTKFTLTLIQSEKEMDYFNFPLPYNVCEMFEEQVYIPFVHYLKAVTKYHLDYSPKKIIK